MKRLFLALSFFALFAFCSLAQPKVDKNYDWAMFDKYEAANAEVTKSPDVIFMGDSITEFWAVQDPEFFENNPNFLCRGISSQVTAQMLARFQNDVIDLNPKVVVIQTGTNDVAKNNGTISFPNVVKQIKSMCEIARLHGITPVIASITPCNKFFWMPEARPGKDIIELNKLIKEYAISAGIIYVDYHSEMTEPDGAMPAAYSKDGCHPVQAGYKVMEKIVMPAIQAALAL